MAAPWLFHNHLASLAIAQVGSLKEEHKVEIDIIKTIGGQPIGATYLFYFCAHVCVLRTHVRSMLIVRAITQQPLP